ncbi:hypothetical protein SAMN05444411_10772 [Lutibacter oricola]|uniref:Uncharacterized protein n=1 Tax=Lutibacter oricola TaxID=762486 RepID=A0A1H3D7B2_9FLAO|nr:hypothetical protein [Lutibacter oricola]SDX62275.1 hypothetical protein SAMN05444411_10772 [Lutibacter oricola]
MKQLLKVCMLFFVINLHAQQDQPNTNEAIIYQGKKHINSEGKKFSFAFDKNDKIKLAFKTEKGKKLKTVTVKNIFGKTIWKSENSFEINQEIAIPTEGVYTFEFKAKSMGSRDVFINISRASNKLYNPAWTNFNTYKKELVNYKVDSMVGYKEPIAAKKEFKVFDRYLYQNIETFNFHSQVLGQWGKHKSQAKGYDLGIDKNLIPRNGKFKGYTYSINSTIGGAKHWVIADVTVSVGALFLSPAASFAAHGAMALVGPQPGNEPIQYFISNRHSDINVVKEIYSPSNNIKKGADKVVGGGKKIGGAIVGAFNKKAGKKISGGGTGIKSYSENDLSYTQKGKVTNLFIYSSKPYPNEWFIVANPERTQAKNIHMEANAIFYAPIFKKLFANELTYDLETIEVPKTTYQYFKSTTYSSIKN